MNNISAVVRLGTVLGRSTPYLIVVAVAAVVATVAIALFFLIKKGSQFYGEWRASFRNEMSQELKVAFAKDKENLLQNSDEELKKVKQEAAQREETIKAQAYRILKRDQLQIEKLLPKVVKPVPSTQVLMGSVFRVPTATEKLITLIRVGNPLVALESLLKNDQAFDKVRTEWEERFTTMSEEVVAYLPLFLKDMEDEQLIAVEGALTELCNRGDAQGFVACIKSNRKKQPEGFNENDWTELKTPTRG